MIGNGKAALIGGPHMRNMGSPRTQAGHFCKQLISLPANLLQAGDGIGLGFTNGRARAVPRHARNPTSSCKTLGRSIR